MIVYREAILSGKKLAEQVDDWSAWLAEGDDPSELRMIRRNIEKGALQENLWVKM